MTTPTTPEQARELAKRCACEGWHDMGDAFASLAAQVEALTAERDAIKQQAQIWKMEALAHKSTVQECYQACTGSMGEPGDWNGANPVRELVAERDELQAELEIANALLKAKLKNSEAGAQPELEALRAELDMLKKQEPVVTIESWTSASYSRNYRLAWHKDAPKGAKLYLAAGAQPDTKELEELRADAENYRWLRDSAGSEIMVQLQQLVVADQWDGAIRLARTKPTQPPATICGNCDTELPGGCGGQFLDDGEHCRFGKDAS